MIEKNTNNSNDCLFECKELIRKHVSSSSLNVSCDEIINALTEEIDIEKFKAWFDRNINYFKTRQNIQPYFNRAFQKELEKGTFELNESGINGVTLFQALREKGVKVIQEDTCYIMVMWGEIFYKCGVKAETIQQLNHKIVDYMKEGQTSKDYIEYVKNSQLVSSLKIDWDKVQKEYEKEYAEWQEILNSLNSIGGEEDD